MLKGDKSAWWSANFYNTNQAHWEKLSKDVSWNEEEDVEMIEADEEEMVAGHEAAHTPTHSTTSRRQVNYAGLVVDLEEYPDEPEPSEEEFQAARARMEARRK